MKTGDIGRSLASYLPQRSVCATCGRVPDTGARPRSYEDGVDVLFHCHGRVEEVFISGAEMMANKIPWSLLLRPFWPGFSVCRAKARPDINRRQLWRERKAAAQQSRARMVSRQIRIAAGRSWRRSLANYIRVSEALP